MTVGPPSLLAQHIQRESQRWEARHRTEPPKTPSISISSRGSDATTADHDSLFSRSPRSRSRRSSISSVDDGDGDDQLPRPPLPFQPQQAPIRIPVYGSLAEAAAQSTIRILGGGAGEVRRLVTPGKLYENEEEDDAIVYDDEVAAG
ncbi:hypothetical protein DL764_005627 [Monosporascus ibericus]|uniref:Uncharacterized protein n=1 Tax=Monosporascus ibericus TaxID=155417 RepID=A0A4Q4TC70_9PEZI|nr:hypothetical protein DL764_005627 [Monosporascus ibericus]